MNIKKFFKRHKEKQFVGTGYYSELLSINGYNSIQLNNILLKNNWTHGAIRSIANAITRLEWTIKPSKFDYLIKVPTPYTSFTDLLEALVFDLYVYGNAVWLVEKVNNTYQLWHIPFWKLVLKMENGKVKGWLVNGKLIDYNDTIHFKFVSLGGNPVLGTSPYEPLKPYIELYENLITFLSKYFKNNAFIGVWGKTDISINEQTRKKIENEIKSMFAGIENAGGIPILSNIDLNEIDTTALFRSLPSMIDKLRQEILSNLGVPPFELGITESVNYANARQQKIEFYEKVVYPLAKKIGNSFTNQSAVVFGNRIELKPILTNLYESSFKERVDSAVSLLAIGISPEKVEEITGIPVSEDKNNKDDKKQIKKSKKQKSKKPLKIDKKYISRAGGILTKTMDIIEEIHTNRYKRFLHKVMNLFKKMKKSEYVEIDKDDLLKNLKEIIDEETNDERMNNMVFDKIKTGLNKICEGINIDFTLTANDFLKPDNPFRATLLSMYKKRWSELLNKHSEDFINEVFKAIDNKITWSELIPILQEQYNLLEKNAETIARTETGWIVNNTSKEFWKENGAEYKIWHNANDDKVRKSHRIAGQIVRFEDKFTLANGVKADFPHDPNLPANEVINCRCGFLPYWKED